MSLLDVIMPAQICFPTLQQDAEGRSRTYSSDASTSCYSYSTCTREDPSFSLTAGHSAILQFLLGEEDAKEVECNLEDYEGEDYVATARQRFTTEELENESLLRELTEDLSFDSDDEEEFETSSENSEEDYDCCGLVYLPCNAEQKLEEQIWYEMTCGKLCVGDTAVDDDDDDATAEETVDETDDENTIETVQNVAALEDVTVLETLEDVDTHLKVTVELIEEQASEPGGLSLTDVNEEDELLHQGDPKGIKSAHADDKSLVDEGEPVVARLSMESTFMEPDGAKLAVGNQKIEVKDQMNGINDGIELVYLENLPGDIAHENASVTSSNWSQWALQADDEIIENTFWEPSIEPSGVKFAENCAYNMARSKVTSEEGTPANLEKQLEALPQMNAATLSSSDESAKEEYVSECRQRSESISSEALSLD
jgi:hypothetical protein